MLTGGATVCFLILSPLLLILGREDEFMHPHFTQKFSKRSVSINKEATADFWVKNGREALRERIQRKINKNVAKNVILFLGDGMSIPTISACRVYIGGEEKQLAFDKFPFTGLSKTYCTDRQVADSACSATAYLGGVKANLGTIGVTAAVKRDDCLSMLNSTNFVRSIAHWAQLKDKMTGLVTTARVTHASPAGLYAHTAERDWESDTDVINSGNPPSCPDIASQLVFGETGRRLNVILGGGRSNFLPQNETDDENVHGRRTDGLNLIHEWIAQKASKGDNPHYIWNRNQLLKLNSSHDETDYLLGLFNVDHMSFSHFRDDKKEPSLMEMTKAAIEILGSAENGYFLFVEGARIDMGHHAAKARLALEETSEFSKAIQAAVDNTNEEDTLIVVTSDHAHTMSYSGYADRGNDVLGFGGKATDGLPYSILNYANGPGYSMGEGGHRHDLTKDDLSSPDYQYPGVFPMESETHGGDDVAVFAKGPWAHLFTGVMEENVLPYLMGFASCVGDGYSACNYQKESVFNLKDSKQ